MSYATETSARGRFGRFGGRYVPETLIAALDELEAVYEEARQDESFWAELDGLLRDYVGRPSPLYFARRLSEEVGTRIYLKREDLNHTGAHKINNTLGQVLLARRMGKRRIIAETGAGQHGVATATACALFGLECVIYMGAEDVRRQALNVYRMRLLGAEVRRVEAGTRTLGYDQRSAAGLGDQRSGYPLCVDPWSDGPFPRLVRDFNQRQQETKRQLEAMKGGCRRGDRVRRWRSNAIECPRVRGQPSVELVGVEAAGKGWTRPPRRVPDAGRPRLHGSFSYLPGQAGQVAPATPFRGAGLRRRPRTRLSQKRTRPVRERDGREALEAFHTTRPAGRIISARERTLSRTSCATRCARRVRRRSWSA